MLRGADVAHCRGNLGCDIADLEGQLMIALQTIVETEHINRFGNYVIDFNRMPEPLEQHPGSLSPVSA
jgi:hypothetical protein